MTRTKASAASIRERELDPLMLEGAAGVVMARDEPAVTVFLLGLPNNAATEIPAAVVSYELSQR